MVCTKSHYFCRSRTLEFANIAVIDLVQTNNCQQYRYRFVTLIILIECGNIRQLGLYVTAFFHNTGVVTPPRPAESCDRSFFRSVCEQDNVRTR